MKMFSYRIESREELALRRTEFKQARMPRKSRS